MVFPGPLGNPKCPNPMNWWLLSISVGPHIFIEFQVEIIFRNINFKFWSYLISSVGKKGLILTLKHHFTFFFLFFNCQEQQGRLNVDVWIKFYAEMILKYNKIFKV